MANKIYSVSYCHKDIKKSKQNSEYWDTIKLNEFTVPGNIKKLTCFISGEN